MNSMENVENNEDAQIAKFAKVIQFRMFRPSAADVASMQAVLMALNQALASGCLRGEEFNTLAEQSPELLYSIAKMMGVQVGELRQMAKQGLLTSDLVCKALGLIFQASASQDAS